MTESSISMAAFGATADAPKATTLRFLHGNGLLAFIVQCWVGLMITLVVAGVAYDMSFNLMTVSQIYFLLVVAYALRFGFWQATVVSIWALMSVEYFFAPPAFSFHIADPQNGIAIIVFEIAALLVSRVSSREREYATAMERKRKAMERLYSISQSALLIDARIPCEQQLAVLIHEQFHTRSVAILNIGSGSVGVAGTCSSGDAALLAERLPENQDPVEGNKGFFHRCLTDGGKQLGVLMVAGELQPLEMDSLAALVSHVIGRHQALMQEGIAEAARRSEQLRTTVLDGLAHAFKTPLTIIRAASSGMLEMGGLQEMQTGLMLMIDEQSMNLDELTTRLLRTARVDGNLMCLESESISVCALIHEVVAEFEGEMDYGAGDSWYRHSVTVGDCAETLEFTADHALLSGTLKELLHNAAKYSDCATPIHITASESEENLLISVSNIGPCIRSEDRERIFDRFYRGVDDHHAAKGTGIGLSVARRVTEAHGGQMWVESTTNTGTTFYMSLPKQSIHASFLPV